MKDLSSFGGLRRTYSSKIGLLAAVSPTELQKQDIAKELQKKITGSPELYILPIMYENGQYGLALDFQGSYYFFGGKKESADAIGVLQAVQGQSGAREIKIEIITCYFNNDASVSAVITNLCASIGEEKFSSELERIKKQAQEKKLKGTSAKLDESLATPADRRTGSHVKTHTPNGHRQPVIDIAKLWEDREIREKRMAELARLEEHFSPKKTSGSSVSLESGIYSSNASSCSDGSFISHSPSKMDTQSFDSTEQLFMYCFTELAFILSGSSCCFEDQITIIKSKIQDSKPNIAEFIGLFQGTLSVHSEHTINTLLDSTEKEKVAMFQIAIDNAERIITNLNNLIKILDQLDKPTTTEIIDNLKQIIDTNTELLTKITQALASSKETSGLIEKVNGLNAALTALSKSVRTCEDEMSFSIANTSDLNETAMAGNSSLDLLSSSQQNIVRSAKQSTIESSIRAEKMASEADQEVAKMQGKIDTLTKEIVTLTRTNAQQKEIIEELQQELVASQEITEEKPTVTPIKLAIAINHKAAETAVDDTTTEVEALQKQLKTEQTRIKNSIKAIEELEQKLTAAHEEKILQEQQSALKIQQLEQAVLMLTRDNNEQIDRIDLLNEQLRAASRTPSAIDSEEEEDEDETEALRVKLQEQCNLNKELQRKLDEAQALFNKDIDEGMEAAKDNVFSHNTTMGNTTILGRAGNKTVVGQGLGLVMNLIGMQGKASASTPRYPLLGILKHEKSPTEDAEHKTKKEEEEARKLYREACDSVCQNLADQVTILGQSLESFCYSTEMMLFFEMFRKLDLDEEIYNKKNEEAKEQEVAELTSKAESIHGISQTLDTTSKTAEPSLLWKDYGKSLLAGVNKAKEQTQALKETFDIELATLKEKGLPPIPKEVQLLRDLKTIITLVEEFNSKREDFARLAAELYKYQGSDSASAASFFNQLRLNINDLKQNPDQKPGESKTQESKNSDKTVVMQHKQESLLETLADSHDIFSRTVNRLKEALTGQEETIGSYILDDISNANLIRFSLATYFQAVIHKELPTLTEKDREDSAQQKKYFFLWESADSEPTTTETLGVRAKMGYIFTNGDTLSFLNTETKKKTMTTLSEDQLSQLNEFIRDHHLKQKNSSTKKEPEQTDKTSTFDGIRVLSVKQFNQIQGILDQPKVDEPEDITHQQLATSKSSKVSGIAFDAMGDETITTIRESIEKTVSLLKDSDIDQAGNNIEPLEQLLIRINMFARLNTFIASALNQETKEPVAQEEEASVAQDDDTPKKTNVNSKEQDSDFSAIKRKISYATKGLSKTIVTACIEAAAAVDKALIDYYGFCCKDQMTNSITINTNKHDFKATAQNLNKLIKDKPELIKAFRERVTASLNQFIDGSAPLSIALTKELSELLQPAAQAQPKSGSLSEAGSQGLFKPVKPNHSGTDSHRGSPSLRSGASGNG